MTNLAVRYNSKGDIQRALDLNSEALAIRRALDDRRGQANNLQNFGMMYSTLGETARALPALDESLAIWRVLGDKRGEGAALMMVGNVHMQRGEWDAAAHDYERGLELRKAAGDRVGEAYALGYLGTIRLQQGRAAEARDLVERSLKVARETGAPETESQALTQLARVLTRSGDLDGARAAAQEALELNVRLRSPKTQALSLFHLAEIERAACRLAEAHQAIEAAMKLLESLRTPLRSADLRASYVASVRSFYDLYVDVLMARHAEDPGAGFDARALEAAERTRARGLLEMLAESRADIRQGVDAQLIDRERRVRARLSAAAERRLRIRDDQSDGAKRADVEIAALTGELESAERDIRDRSPRYAALTQPQPLSVRDAQALLDDSTLLLVYSLGENASYAWTVGEHSLASVRLPPRAEIESAARIAHEAISHPSSTPRSATANLSRMVLAPLARELGRRRLVIVADGALQYIPFASLPDPVGRKPLVVRHEIAGLPSASALALLREDPESRRRSTRTLAILADPVFDAGDERVAAIRSPLRTAATPVALPADSLARAADAAGLTGAIPRLLYTRREANAILAGVRARSSFAAFDFDANRAAAIDPKLAGYRFVHFATHGFLNAAHPDLSGLVLSLVDRQGKPQAGFLTAADTFNLQLSADLVVLSGCRTALGKEIRSEGLVGLSRGFMYAGARAVLASLWSVDDAATASLMSRLYTRMLAKDGLPPAAALRAAQLELMKQPRFQHPYYWAAFQLQGEWR